MTTDLHPGPNPPAPGWQGTLKLEFVAGDDRTQLAHCYGQAPLKLQRPFYPEGGVCHGVTLHTAGGIVGGDRLAFQIDLHPHSHALLTTATAGKIYRSTGPEALQTTQIQIAEAACLEWLPQETILFDGAILQQQTRIDLAETALWMGWEITRLGRTARGEQFAHGMWRSRTEVWQQGHPLWVDPQWLQGGSAMLTSPHGLAGCPVVGSFAIVGREVPSQLLDAARQCWEERAIAQVIALDSEIPHTAPTAQAGVTRLMRGMLCRYRGHSTLEVRRWFTDVWHQARLAMLDRPACKPRVW